MHKHASMNRAFRLVWNEALNTWIPVAEIARGRRKRNRRTAAVTLLAMLGLTAMDASAAPPAPAELPHNGHVVTGVATIDSSTSADGAVMNINQSTQRAIIDWDTFNVGSAAQVNFNQPGRDAATLNRVLDTNPSQIFGKITATGQVFLTNPNGVYFSKTASVNVGGLVATTHSIDNDDFMAGKSTFKRDGATGTVTNEGTLQTSLGGYIALLAPEVRNSGVVIAQLGTVAMAAGESFTLNFQGNHLTSLTVEPSQIRALVDNKSAVLAPGGTIILSAQALDRLQGGVVRNSGTLEATGMSMKDGHIVLEASSAVENSGTINANAGTDGSPAGTVSIDAPQITNSGTITAAAVSAPDAATVTHAIGGHIELTANTIQQSSAGKIDVSGAVGGTVAMHASEDVSLQGVVRAASVAELPSEVSADADLASVLIDAANDVTLQNVTIDVSGELKAGQIVVTGGRAPSPLDPSGARPTLALIGATELRTSSRRGRGGSISLTADRVGLFDASSIDATGALGGGNVFVGGGFHGEDPSITNAQQVVIGRDAHIDASATRSGNAGDVAVWSDGHTQFNGNIAARGGANSGNGGFVEVSGAGSLDFRGSVDASATHGIGGTLLLDPKNIIVQSGGGALTTDVDQFADSAAADSTIDPNTITAITNTGTGVTLQANNDITVNSSIVSNNAGGNGGALTFQAGRSISINASITSDNGDVSFTANDVTGTGADRDPGAATFTNSSLVDAGSGDVTITMSTQSTSGAMSVGQVTANDLTINYAGINAASITLGELDIAHNLVVSATGSTQTVAQSPLTAIIVRNIASIRSNGGDVTLAETNNDFSIFAANGANVTLNDANGVQLGDASGIHGGASAITGTFSVTTKGPIGNTGVVNVTGLTTLTPNNGGFGVSAPDIFLNNYTNNFGQVDVAQGTGGGAVYFADADGISLKGTYRNYLSVNAAGAVTQFGDMNVGGTMYIAAGSANDITLNTGTNLFNGVQIGSGRNVNVSDSNGGLRLYGSTVSGNLTLTLGGTGNFNLDYGDTTNVTGSMSVSVNSGIFEAEQSSRLNAGSLTATSSGTFQSDWDADITINNGDMSITSGGPVTFARYADLYVTKTSAPAGNLSIQSFGDITQDLSQYNEGRIQVAGNTTFTVTKANSTINLQQNNNKFDGSVSLNTSGAGTYTNVYLRNISSNAGTITGLGGSLANVTLYYDNAASLTIPGMTLSGALTVTAPSGSVDQSGALTVAGNTVLLANAAKDIDLGSSFTNDFNNVTISSAKNATLKDSNAINFWREVFLYNGGNLNVTAGGAITDSTNDNNYKFTFNGNGTATFNAGTNPITLDNVLNDWGTVVVQAATDVTIYTNNSIDLGNVSFTGNLTLDSWSGGSLTQSGSTAISMSPGTTATLRDFYTSIVLNNADNVLGALAISNAGTITIRENDAITQASAWTNLNSSGGNSTRYDVALTTSDDQAITLDQAGSVFGNLTITQINNGAGSAGGVYVRETGDSIFGLTQGSAWTVHGTTKLDSGTNSINLNNANNVFGPLQVLASTGTTNGAASIVTLYAKNPSGGDAITDVGGTGAWNTGTNVVKLVAYDTTGTTAGGGDVILTNAGNVLGDLYVKATDATITENDNITDGVSTPWFGSDSGWATTGTTTLVVANPTGRSITLDNLNNQLSPIAITTTGTAGNLSSVLITDNSDLTQAAAWLVGSAPVTLDARNHAIDLSTYDNVLGNITINTTNGSPTSIAITEDDAITQGTVWSLTGSPVTLWAKNGKSITLTNASNILGNLTITGGVASITENDNITQGGAWTTTGTTTLNAGANAITLGNAGNVLGNIAIGGAPTAITLTENDDITQASAWSVSSTPITLNSGAHDVLLSQAANQLGDLTITGQNATIVENDAAGITDGTAWTVAGTTTLTAGNANPIVLNANPNSDFGTVSIVSASNADIADANAINFGASTIAAGGTLTVTAGGQITQSGTITAPSLRLIGTGYATLNNVNNNVQNLAAGFSGGDLSFTNGGNFAVGVIGGTTGVTIGANDVSLTSVNGTITSLSNINASSSSLTLSTGTALTLPQMTIAGAQTYTASTVSGTGITLTAGVTSTAGGAINFMSPVTLGADLSIQSSNSDINFHDTLAGGGNQLTVNAGTGHVDFQGAVTALGSTIDAGAALTLTSSGATFESTLGANNGLAITGPVTFKDTVTLADGNAASVFTGLVTLGKVGGMNLSGYDGMTFTGGVSLQNGPATINSNNSALSFQTAGSVSGPYDLTLDSGTAVLTGLDRMDTNLTSLTVTALNPTIPAGGVSIAGAQTYTATNGSSITLNGNVASTASGAITFNSPVSVGATATVTSLNSAIVFGSTIDGAHDLTVNSGSGVKTFTGAIGGNAALGDGTGAALTLQGSGASTFSSTVQTRSGITAAGVVTFNDDVTLGNGDTGSVFSSLVTTGGADGNSISGYDGLTFNGGVSLAGGPINIASNGSTIAFGGSVSGPRVLTLNALAGGAGTVTGLDNIGFTSDLTGLYITAHTLSLPSTGLAVAGPMSFTAAGGITLNGAVGNNAGPTTGQIDFTGPVTLGTGAIAITTNNAAVNFNGTVDGGEDLTVNAGSGTTTFGSAVGATTAVASLTTDAGGTIAINGGSITTSGAQIYNDAVTLGADATLTGVDVEFLSTLNGAHALVVNNSGPTVFGGLVGNTTALTSITTDAPGTVVVNTTAVKTSGSQTYNENMTLGADVTFTGVGLTFDDIDGAHTFTANAGSGAVQINGAVGATTPVTSVTATGNTISVHDVTSTGAQGYTASGGVTLNGDLATTNSNVTVTGPTTLAGDSSIATTGGDITFSGATSTINGAHDLTLTAGSGNVVLGGVVGGTSALTGISLSGNDLTLPGINTVGDLNQTYTALNNITLNQSRLVNAPVAFTADSDGDGSGSFILLNGVSLSATNNTLDIHAADLDLQGSSTLSSGTGVMTITATNARNIALGGTDAAGQMTISGSELSRIITSGGLTLQTTGTGWIHVNGITSGQSQNITGTMSLHAQGTGEVAFITGASAFNALTAQADGGNINVGVNVTTSNDPIDFVTAVQVSGASTITSGGGNISFDSTLAVDNDLTLSTGNGVLTFGGDVGSNKTLTLNLGGGSVSGLSHLQSTLTGLTVNGTSGITLPAFTINGPQVYNTGPITVTGNLGGVGITFNNVVDVVPSVGTAITIDSGTGSLVFNNLSSFNAVDMTLIGDEIDFTKAITGSGALILRPYTTTRDLQVGGSGGFAGLNLTASEIAWLPIGTLSSITIGDGAGTGQLVMTGTLNAPGTPITLNGGGGISQTGGSITSGSLRLYAAGNAISLTRSGNAFGAVGITGTPTSVSLVNTLDITQLGAAAWNLGTANVTLNAGTHDITLNNAGNTFGTLALTGRNVQVTEAAATDVGASTISGNLTLDSSGDVNFSGALANTGNVSIASAGVVSQSAALTIGGNLDIATSVNAGDVTLNNSGASSTTIGNTLVGGNYVLTATGQSVTQGSGSSLQVRGDLTVTGSSIVLGGAGNLIGGTTTLPATNTTELRQSGVITLGDRTEAGNLTVISERTNRSFSSALVNGDAVVLDNASNNIGGRISVSASTPTIATGADVQTGINQTAGTSLSVAGVASFTAESSGAGSLGIDLTNDGNSFGHLVLSGTTVNVKNSAAGTTTIDSASASTDLTLNTAGAINQGGSIVTPTFNVTAAGPIALTNAGNDVTTLNATTTSGAISYTDANSVAIAGVNAGGGDVTLTAGGSGNLTQTGGLTNVGTLSANAGGAVTLNSAANTIASLGASTAGTGFQLFDSSGGLTVTGIARTTTGDETVRTSGDLTLNSGGRLEADAGDVIASTEGAGNFINNSGASALVVGSGKRWLVYSSTPDLVAGAHTVKGGLTSSFRHYGADYTSYAPGSVAESGSGFIYSAAAPSLTVSAIITGSATHVYGSTPTGALDVSISTGLLDSEDNVNNVITGGTATFDRALSNTMNAGTYTIKYTGGLTSNYTLVADSAGATYTVTAATLTYTADAATRQYGQANPVLSGSISGFVLGQDASVLTGSPVWTTTATATSDAGHYAINGSGYSSSGNYVFAQAAGNATALDITKAGLTVTFSNDSRTYNGTAYSGGAGVSYSGFVNGETSSVLGGTLVYGGTSQGARNAGTYVISGGGISAANYAINYVNGSLTIDRANISLTANDITKTYDGSLSASGTAAVASGSQLFGSDTLSGGTFAFTNANAGTGNKTVNVSGVTVSDGNGGNNYNVSYVANTTSTINPASITVSSSNVVKTYDGTLAANGSAIVTSGALYHNASNGNAQDTLSGGSFAFTDKNAGSGNKRVSVGGASVTDGNGGGNYVVTYADNTTSTINRATLTFNGTIADREYDGTTGATLSSYSLTGLIGTETLNATAGGASFVDKNAGNGKAVSITGIGLSDGGNGGLASNYTINPTAAAVGNITPRLLSLNAVVDDKVYDGTTNATLQSFGLGGFVGSETVTGVYTGTASFADRHVGDNKNITVTGIDLVNGTNGGLASNYAVPTTANSTASITPASLHVAGVVALDRVYDGTTTVVLNTDAATVTGLFGSDEVEISQITGTFLDKNVGTNKSIGAGTVMLSGADAGDYVLIQPTGLSASITPRALLVSATGVNRVYDGTTNATVILGDNRVSGDSLNVTANSSFIDKNAGSGKYVNVTGIAISGADAGNYTVNSTAGTSANITRANLNVSVTGVNRVYDGTTHATVALNSTPIGNDDVQLQYVAANFGDKNVGTGKAVSVTGIAGFGADASNYVINSTGATTANITPATLNVAANGTIKTFDGSTAATVTFTDNRIAGDDVSLVATNAAYANPNVGTGKAIAVDGIVIAGGADAANYVLANTSTSTTGAILGQTSVAETWPLPPTIPTPVPPSIPTTPPVVVDVSLPMIGGGGSNGGGNIGGNGGGGNGGSNTTIITNTNTGGGTNTNTGGNTGGNGGSGGGGTGTVINTSGGGNGGTGNTGGGANTSTNINTGGNNGGNGGNGGGGTIGVGGTTIIPIGGGSGGTGGGGNGGNNTNTNASGGGYNGGGTGTDTNASSNTNTSTNGGSGGGSNGSTGGNNTGSNASGGGAGTNTNTNTNSNGGGASANPSSNANSSANSGSDGGSNGGNGGNNTGNDGGGTGANSSGNANSSANSGSGGGSNGGNGNNSSGTNASSGSGGADSSNATNSASADGSSNSGNSAADAQGGTSGAKNGANASGDAAGSSDASSSADGSSNSADGNGSASASSHGVEDHVVVSVVRTPLGDYPGLVTVQVPHKLAASGKGFSFALPAAMLDGGNVKVTRADGKRLPTWLKYDPATHTVIATSPPANALPIELLVRVGNKRWTMMVGEQQ